MKIHRLSVQRFRALRDLQISDFGRVNLITGRNNTGKSSVLEALRILASDASPSLIRDILRFREEDAGDGSRSVDSEGAFLPSSLFYGFPRFSTKIEPIVIKSRGGEKPMDLSIQMGLASERHTSEGFRILDIREEQLVEEGEGIPILIVMAGGSRRALTLDSFSRTRPFGLHTDLAGEPRLPCVFVSPYGGKGTADLGYLWDKIALSDREKDVVEALRIIDPEILAVSMVGGESPPRPRIAIVRSRGLARPVPLRSFGDGLNRLFGIVLSLVNATDGLLLIDEFENGMHHTVQTDVWRAIFKLASMLDVQVVATSHSWDSIEAFQKAASETPEDGVLIRLSRKGEEIIPTFFREDELAVATREGIEVR